MMQKARNLGIDMLCCFGVMLLLGLQYIEAVGYFDEPIRSWSAAAPVAARWFCLSGAMVLSAGTGYALSDKKFSMGYFKIFIRLIYVYVIGTLCALGMRVLLLREQLDPVEVAQAFVQFTATDTGRFAGMYFALLLAAPFLNAALHGLPTRQARMTFLIIAAAFSTLQPMLWFSDVYLLPEWCEGLFPAAAYIGGAYMKRYARQKHVPLMILILILTCAAQTAAVMYASLTKEMLYCPWLDSVATLPCLGIALCLLGIFYSKKKGKGSVHKFFAGAAGGALAALLLGDPLIDIVMPAVDERFPDMAIRFWAGAVIVPVIFILCCVLGLALQLPLLGIRSKLQSAEAEEDAEDDVIPLRTRKKPKASRSDVVVPERTHTRPRPTATEHNPRHTIRVAVSEPEAEVSLTQPAEENPPGTRTLELQTPEAPPTPPESSAPPAPEHIAPERTVPSGREFPTMKIPAQKPKKDITVEDILGIPEQKPQKNTTESIEDLLNRLSD